VLLGDLADDRETEAASLAPSRVRTAVEAVEHVWEVVVGDARPVVADADASVVNGDLDDAVGG
jgi:hypothetical protein